MFQPDTQRLIDVWTGLALADGVRGGIPGRSAFPPEILGARLPRAFTVEWRGDQAVLRTAGGWLEFLHNRALAGSGFLELWRPESRPLVDTTLSQAIRQARPMVIIARAGDPGVTVEVSLAPLRGRSGRPDRVIGLMSPATSIALDHDSPCLLTARLAVAAGDRGRPDLNLAALGGRRLA